MRSKGFTLVELLVVIAIIVVLAGALFLMINPARLIEKSRYASAVESLESVAKAASLYAVEHGDFPADATRNIPVALTEYVSSGTFPGGSFPGSVYDWDNWVGTTCWDGTTNIIQITLRQINNYKDKTDYNIYYVLQGEGIPHCSEAAARGECVNCVSRYP